MEYYVNYRIGSRLFQVGPYGDYDEAEWNRRDVAGYKDIEDCYVANERQPERHLVCG